MCDEDSDKTVKDSATLTPLQVYKFADHTLQREYDLQVLECKAIRGEARRPFEDAYAAEITRLRNIHNKKIEGFNTEYDRVVSAALDAYEDNMEIAWESYQKSKDED